MEQKLFDNYQKLVQIGKSNNSYIYKAVAKDGKGSDAAIKLINHKTKEHPKEC